MHRFTVHLRQDGSRHILAFLLLTCAWLVNSCSGSSFSGKNRIKKDPPPVDSNIEEKDCLPPNLPTSVVEPKKVFTFVPTGEYQSFQQFASTTGVAKLRETDTSASILAIGFKKSVPTNPIICHGGVYDPGLLFAIDGKTGSQKWVGRSTSGVPVDLDAVVAPATADVDGDGKMEVFAIERSTGFVVAFDSDGVLLWKSGVQTKSRANGSILSSWAHGISIADLDRDGSSEVIAPGMVLNAQTGTTKHELPPGQHVYPADTNLSGQSEIIFTDGIADATGTYMCRFEKPLANIGIAQLQKDDTFLSIVGPSLNETPVKLISYRGDNCALIFEKEFGDNFGGPPNIADFDGASDQNLEIGIAGQSRYAVFSHSGELIWSRPTQDASSARTGSTAFDFNGDGKTEVVYNDEKFLRVFDGRSGDIIYEAQNTSYTAHEYPVVADVDGNGTANIVAVANDCQGGNTGISVYSAPQDDWVKTRPIWSQHGFDPLAINNNGTVTAINQDAILMGALTSPHLAGFRNNIAYPPGPGECK